MERAIARLNERLTVQRNTTAVDKYGNHRTIWEDYFSCYCYAGTYRYDRERESVVTSEVQTVNFEVRYCPELASLDSTHYRVLFHGDSYDIQSVDFMNYQKSMIKIICKLAGKGGAA